MSTAITIQRFPSVQQEIATSHQDSSKNTALSSRLELAKLVVAREAKLMKSNPEWKPKSILKQNIQKSLAEVPVVLSERIQEEIKRDSDLVRPVQFDRSLSDRLLAEYVEKTKVAKEEAQLNRPITIRSIARKPISAPQQPMSAGRIAHLKPCTHI